MSSSGADIKGFYKQKKKNAGISKPSSTKSRSNSKSPTSFVSKVTQSPVLDLQENNASEEELRQFDMNMAYGPCVGMNRMDRWSRARSLGLNPPGNIHHLLTSAANDVCSNSLWDGCV